MPSTRLVGVTGEFISSMEPGSNAHVIIPELWKKLNALIDSDHLDREWSLGYMTRSDEPGTMRYAACVRADSVTSALHTLDEIVFAGGTYLGCEHVGPLDSIAATTRWFYAEYLPASKYRVIDGPHLEIYDERFELNADESIVTIAVPIAVN